MEYIYLMRSRLIDKAICSEARHDLEARLFLAERENMQYRRSSDSRATADPHDRFKEQILTTDSRRRKL